MAKIRLNGSYLVQFSSLWTLGKIACKTYIRHMLGRRLDPSWNTEIEIGIRFWRHQFTKAMAQSDMRQGRRIFDSLQTDTDDVYDVAVENQASPLGTWYRPASADRQRVVLYFHGGGYAFNGPISERFAAMFAHHANAHLFAPKYRLTPEHPHPAQAEDALAAWKYVRSKVPAENVIVMGDSAGGHMALMLLQTLKREGLKQPALCIGLCPWTDIGDRGESLRANNRFDLVQGWMALRFGEWLDPAAKFGREALSPIYYNYAGLAPLYLQAGGREILRDMINEFAEVQMENGATLMLDQWEDMPHNFHAYDNLKTSATQALQRVRSAIDAHIVNGATISPLEEITKVASREFGGAP